MTAIKKEELERLEAEHGLEEDGLTYQQRCSRITAIQKGEEWTKPEPAKPHKADITKHPLYGKKILITPMMKPDANRALAYDEKLGPYMEVKEVQAGERIYGEPEDVQRMIGDYEIVRRDPSRQVIAKTTFPKVGTEISYTVGKDIVPVVRGNDGQTGYIWSFPTKVIQIDDTRIQLVGLKTLITNIYPELLMEFRNKPMMSYIDGVTLVASIPLTTALLKKKREEEAMRAAAGLN